MLLIISSAAVGIMAAFAIYSFLRFNGQKSAYVEIKDKFRFVDKEQDALKLSESKYSELQKSYLKSKGQLSSLERQIQQYSIGIGTVDNKVFQRTTEFEKLEPLTSKLSEVKEQAKLLVKDKKACICDLGNNLQVNGRKAGATKLINREIKLRIRCFDNEVEAAIVLANWNNINRLVERVRNAFDDINTRGKIIKTQLQPGYRDLKISELKLSYEISQLKSDIKEAEREERKVLREAEREEGKIKAAAEKAQEDRERMEKLVQKELQKYESATEEQKALLVMHQEELAILKGRENRAVSMAQKTRAGYVYIISNKVAFGPDMIKIGMTRRVDPNDRVHELGDASVPDTFDVHAFFYSEDAPALESELHNMFADKRVNLINKRKEFFHLPFNHVIDAIDNGNFEVQRTL
jgi:predicted  nucleic acid-binding Zn-ribbon protein